MIVFNTHTLLQARRAPQLPVARAQAGGGGRGTGEARGAAEAGTGHALLPAATGLEVHARSVARRAVH